MAENEFTTISIDKETFGLLKELCRSDLRSTPKEVLFLVQTELARRSKSKVVRIPVMPFTGKGDEIGDAFRKVKEEA